MATAKPFVQVISPPGGTDSFEVPFPIPTRRLPQCFIVPPGEDDAREKEWRIADDQFVFTPLDNTAVESIGTVKFNYVVPEGSLVSVWQTNVLGTDIDFTRKDSFNPTLIATALQQITASGSVLQWENEIASFRNALSTDQAKLTYNNIMPPLNPNDFFRRGTGVDSNRMIAQDTAKFAQEIANIIAVLFEAYVNVTEHNLESIDTMLKAQGTFEVTVGAIDKDGKIYYTTVNGFGGAAATNLSTKNVQNTFDMLEAEETYSVTISNYVNGQIVTKTLSGIAARAYFNAAKDWAMSSDPIDDVLGNKGFSARVAALTSKDWAQAVGPITDPWDNTGFSAEHFAKQAATNASAAGGVIDELAFTCKEEGQTIIDLVEYDVVPTIPWENVTPQSFSVYKNGIPLLSPGAYGPDGPDQKEYDVKIEISPTVEKPSQIIMIAPLVVGDKIQVKRSEAQGDSASMYSDSTNARFTVDSKLLSRDGSNVIIPKIVVTSPTQLNNVLDGLDYRLYFGKNDDSPFNTTTHCDFRVRNENGEISQTITSFDLDNGGTKFRISLNNGVVWSDWHDIGAELVRAEAVLRNDADIALGVRIGSEEIARSDADKNLQSQINTLNAQVLALQNRESAIDRVINFFSAYP